MRLQIVSDLHLSQAPCELPDVGADLLVVPGDVERPQAAMAWARAQVLPVVFVAGNHEYYGSSLAATDRTLRDLARDSRVTVLDCGEWRYGGVRFLGATLWTDFRLDGDGIVCERAMAAAAAFSRDFSRIYVDDARTALLAPSDCVALFARHVAWLMARLDEPFAGETVVITHFAPSRRSVAARYAGSPVNAGFVSALDALVRRSGAALWVHGHTHDSFDYRIGRTRVICNPRGYSEDGQAENLAFDPGLTVNVG